MEQVRRAFKEMDFIQYSVLYFLSKRSDGTCSGEEIEKKFAQAHMSGEQIRSMLMRLMHIDYISINDASKYSITVLGVRFIADYQSFITS